MLKVITEQTAIKKHAGQFNKKFKPFIDEEIKVNWDIREPVFPLKYHGRVTWASGNFHAR